VEVESMQNLQTQPTETSDGTSRPPRSPKLNVYGDVTDREMNRWFRQWHLAQKELALQQNAMLGSVDTIAPCCPRFMPNLNKYGDLIDREENAWLRQWHHEQMVGFCSLRSDGGPSSLARAAVAFLGEEACRSPSGADELRQGRGSLARTCGIIALALPTWFSANAFLPEVATDYSLDNSQASLLTIAVNIGFVVATTVAAAVRLPDKFSAAALVGLGSLFCGAFNALMIAGIPYAAVLAARFMSGAAICLIYPVAVRYLSTWFRASRGLALGCLIGSFTLGVAIPNLVRALLPGLSWQEGIAVPSVLAVGAWALARGMREGPYTPKRSRISVKEIWRVVRNPDWALVTVAYMGHSFELYGGWAWMGAFMQSRMADPHGAAHGGSSQTMVYMATFCVVGIGSVGCVSAGLLADRFGKIETIALSNVLSGVCIWVLPFVPSRAGPLPVMLLAGVWGFSVNADSAQYSAMITEAVPDDRAGTAVTLSIACGFVMTAIAMYVVPGFVQGLGWEGAFPVLGLGPVVSLGTILCLKRKKTSVFSARACASPC